MSAPVVALSEEELSLSVVDVDGVACCQGLILARIDGLLPLASRGERGGGGKGRC